MGAAQEPAGSPAASAFEGASTHVLANGLRVWIQRLPGDPNVGVSLTLPHGRDADPVGREQLAHFVEHMLFKQHLGRSELEIAREVSERGGTENGVTYDDHSAYFVHVPREHGDFAIDWLWRVASPHEMVATVVDAEREPIALEIGARRREFVDELRAKFVNPAWARLPGFWEREYGIRTYDSRDYDPWRSLHAIGPEDLERFYAAYYVPGRMLLSVSGDLDPAEALAAVERTFGTLEPGPAPAPVYELHDPGRRYEAYRWQRRASVWYRTIHKLYDPPPEDVLTAMFAGRFLGERLTELLRRSDDKAVYGLSVGIDQRGPAVAMQIQAEIRRDLFPSARATIEAEVQALAAGSHDPQVFRNLRDSIARQLRTSVSEAADVMQWRHDTLYDARFFPDLPDLPREMEAMTQERLADFATRTFVPEREVLEITYPDPLSSAVRWAATLGLVGLTYRLGRLVLVRRIDMRRLVYVARLRLSLPYALVAGGLALGLAALLGRLLLWAWSLAYARWVLPLDDFAVQAGVRAAGLVLATALVVGVLARVPRKFVLLDDELRVKGLLFRSRVIRPEDVTVIGLRGFREVWLSPTLFSCSPLTLGLVRPQIYLETRSGRAYFVRVRARDELLEVLRDFAPRARA